MKRSLPWRVLALVGFASAADPSVSLPPSARSLDLAAAEAVPVLSGGRIKPLRVAATEGVQEIRGRSSLTRDLGPMASWFAISFHPDTLAAQRVVWFPEKELRSIAGMDPAGQFASFRELTANRAFLAVLAEANDKASRSERLSAVESAARDAGRRLEKFSEAAAGEGWRVLPGPRGREGSWRLPQEVDSAEVAADPVVSGRMAAFGRLAQAYRDGDQAAFDRAASELVGQDVLVDSLSSLGDGAFLRTRRSHVAAELSLVRWHPFRISWILLLASFLLAWAAHVAGPGTRAGRPLLPAAWGAALAGLAVLAVGFALRIYVSGRAPVTDMYETTLWVGFGCLAIGLGVARLYRSAIVLSAAAAAGCAVLVLADNLPTVLDPSIHPLVPVLRSNFWLTLHVLTVTLSYAAFLLAMALGNLGLAQEFRAGSDDFRRDLSRWIHRSMQLGVLLLTAGILLGGVWADYSWGRFWGWDPKETWSLIADLGYLAVLHGRFSGWIRTFGTAMGAVLAFFGVVMAWYGVNFVLASGLHSYGFSRGGAAGIAVFAVVQSAFAAAAWIRHRGNRACAA